MPIIKTADLIGPALDWAVAKSLEKVGHDSAEHFLRDFRIGFSTRYSSTWSQGGPIIEEKRISLRVSTMPGTDWAAFFDVPNVYHAQFRHKGPTALIAGMRSFVESELGHEVDVPEELLS